MTAPAISPFRLQTSHFYLTIPNHVPLRLGTFKSILKLVALHHGISIEELLEKLGL